MQYNKKHSKKCNAQMFLVKVYQNFVQSNKYLDVFNRSNNNYSYLKIFLPVMHFTNMCGTLIVLH